MRPINKDEATAARRRVYFMIFGTDGSTPATSEAGGQPQISTDGAAWTATGIGVLVAIGNGRYYADIAQASVATVGAVICSRYSSGSAAEAIAEDAIVVAAPGTVGGLPTVDSSGKVALTSAEHTLISGTDVPGALTAQGVTSTRAAYLDKLNISGNVASSNEVTSIQNNTRCVRVVPEVIERPDSGTVAYRIELLLYDDVGNMEAPDAAPTIALVNQSGTDLSARLDSGTMTLVSTGRYRSIYTASVGDTLEQLVWTFSVVEGSATRVYGNTTTIVDTTAVDFTSSDRTALNAINTSVGSGLRTAVSALPSDSSIATAVGASLATAHGSGSWLTGGGGSAPTVVEIRQELDANSTKLTSIKTGVDRINAGMDNAKIPGAIVDDAANSTTVFTASFARAPTYGMSVAFLNDDGEITARPPILSVEENGSNWKITVPTGYLTVEPAAGVDLEAY